MTGQTPESAAREPVAGTDLADRYGTRRPWRRRIVLGIAGVIVLAGLVWLAWAIWFQSNPEVQSSLQSYSIRSAHEARADVVVQLRRDGVDAHCSVTAYASDHSVVGELAFTPQRSPKRQLMVVEIRTEREATSVEMVGCTAPGQTHPR